MQERTFTLSKPVVGLLKLLRTKVEKENGRPFTEAETLEFCIKAIARQAGIYLLGTEPYLLGEKNDPAKGG